ncbi:MAG: hypothetical protein EGR78_00890 [Erysipelotrichaceae bacterium]|nr:hypothetical protein [Erysipelotrichaceae bacterium]
MEIDLSSLDIFESNKINFDKKITFIFGKNGTGKSTITKEIKKLTTSYEISIFQGFSDLIDENKRLNAVILGEENKVINNKIENKKSELIKVLSELETIEKSLNKPEDEHITNFWTKKYKAEQDYLLKEKKIDDFYSEYAAKIKRLENPRISDPTYNKRNFKDDIVEAHLLSEEDLIQNIETIKSEIKNAPKIDFPKINFHSLENDTNILLKKYIIERIKIPRLENNADKIAFAKNGLEIHKKGEICSFCGNKIEDNTLDELSSYFSADEIKSFQSDLQTKINEIDNFIQQITNLFIDKNNFYPSFTIKINKIEYQLEKLKIDMLIHLNKLKNILNNKFKYLFEESSTIDLNYYNNFDDIEKIYEQIRINNNNNNLLNKKEEAKDRVRKHYVKIYIDEFKYDTEIKDLNLLKSIMELQKDEFNTQEKKIIGPGGLNEKIETINNEISKLQRETKNEIILTQKINKKLNHMVSFELVHVEDEESNGYYRVKNTSTGLEREITELSTGEKNIIAFLYFIEKLEEIKEIQNSKPRIIIFDDPMSSNDESMQYLIIDELQQLMNKLSNTDHFILLTHNKHFYLNVKYSYNYKKNRFIRFQSDGYKTHFIIIEDEKDDYKTSYESLWNELKSLYYIDSVSADLLLNPIRRIIETFTKFNAINKVNFYSPVNGAMKLFNVNSHSIDDLEAELNGKTKNEIIQIFYNCFSLNKKSDHFKKFWSDLIIDENDQIIFPH